MKLAPIILFVYNRPQHTQQTINALLKNDLASESKLIVYSDGPKKNSEHEVRKVREYLQKIQGFKEVRIIERAENWGLAQNIISGVSEVLQKYERTIVLEDDLITSPFFLTYMNQAMEMYKDEKKVASIHGFIYPTKENLPETFFLRGADCSGWGTWQRAWNFFEKDATKLLGKLSNRKLCDEFDYNGAYPFTNMLKDFIKGENNSWAIRWYASAFLEDMLTLYPGKPLIENIGMDGSGTHCGQTNVFDVELSVNPVQLQKLDIQENLQARKIVSNSLQALRPFLTKRIINKMKSIVKILFKGHY